MTRARSAVLAAAVTGLLMLPPLSQRVLAPSDEVRFVIYAQETLQQHAAFDVHVRAKRFREKPPLYAWLIALASWPGGRVTGMTARLPVAVAAIGAGVFTCLIGHRLLGPAIGMRAGLVLAVTYGFFAHSQLILPDMLVVAFTCAAMYAFTSWQHGRRSGIAMPIAFYAATAFGVYAKGPVGLLPFLICGVWLWAEDGAAGLRCLWSPLGALTFGFITLTWLLPFIVTGGTAFADDVIWQDWIRWYAGRPQLARFFGDAAVMCLPWTILVPLVLVAAIGRRDVPVVRLLLAWLLVSFCVIAPMANQRTRYLLPMTPPLALLVAWWSVSDITAYRAARRALALVSLVAGSGIVVAVAWPRMLGTWRPPYVMASGQSWWPLMIATLLVTGALAWGLYGAAPRILVYGSVVGMAVMLGYGVRLYNERYNEIWNFPALAEAVEQHAHGGAVGVFGGRWFALDYYLGRRVFSTHTRDQLFTYVSRSDHPVVVTNERTWDSLRTSTDSALALDALEQRSVGGQTLVIVRARATSSTPPRVDR
jgi:4-amino-4-deoxy-L-arabinose transferase-like glycosyltransferase